jgi:hypothetical protein
LLPLDSAPVPEIPDGASQRLPERQRHGSAFFIEADVEGRQALTVTSTSETRTERLLSLSAAELHE